MSAFEQALLQLLQQSSLEFAQALIVWLSGKILADAPKKSL
jgi:hypothetical protein